MSTLKIYAAYHMPYEIYRDNIIEPIHIGKVISKYNMDMIDDSVGDNISEKRFKYCELAAQYWVWKNVHDVDYVGFCHYRSYFDIDTTNNDWEKLFDNASVVMTSPLIYWSTMEKKITRYVSIEDFSILLMVIKKLYPEYEKSVLDWMYGCTDYTKNMFICRKDIFDNYATWLFNILFSCETYIKESGYSRQKRSLAYLGEFLMPIYFHHNKFKINTVHMIGSPLNRVVKAKSKYGSVKKILNLFRRKIIGVPKSFDDYYLDPVLVGLKDDQIIIK